MAKSEKKYDRYNLVESNLIRHGARCIREETSSDNRFTLGFFICNGRLALIQHFPEHDGVEVFRPINEKNDLPATIKDTLEWFGVNDTEQAA